MPTNPVHVLIDFTVEDLDLLSRPQPAMSYLREAVLAGGATILFEHVHQFEPGGFSGILLLAQSHASIHTWIEDQLVSIDVFGCGPLDVDAIVGTLRARFRPKAERVERRKRGVHAATAGMRSPTLP